MTSTDTTFYDTVDSPVGELLMAGDGSALTGLRMGGSPGAGWRRDRAAFRGTVEQLRAYFAGELRQFDLPLAPRGTPFQRSVWAALRKIPYGETVSYAELAAAAGRPGSARAAGAANGRNPIAIVIPCHRVIGSTGALIGYGGGLPRKRLLLDLEAASRTWTLIGADGNPYRPCAVCMPDRYAAWKRGAQPSRPPRPRAATSPRARPASGRGSRASRPPARPRRSAGA
jgi:methylated-DNA-[protein]-cysteine S-methyltransferase